MTGVTSDRTFYKHCYEETTVFLKGVKIMDELKIGSKLMKMILSRVLKRVVKTKFGYDADIRIEELNAVFTDGKAHIHINADADMEKEELMKLLKGAGVD